MIGVKAYFIDCFIFDVVALLFPTPPNFHIINLLEDNEQKEEEEEKRNESRKRKRKRTGMKFFSLR